MNQDQLVGLRVEITRRLLAVCAPQQIILFGSHARGEAGPDSDIDLLVIADEIESPRSESVRLRRALRGLGVPIDVIVATPQQIERYRDAIGLIYRSALREGEVIYERAAA
ncbi:MAG: nucleotidyltransferase domain-containing protein [Chloroflexi bacterium]|nr:nucleotidyltransferase domain-containing protein [Chloroflexota bacterium]